MHAIIKNSCIFCIYTLALCLDITAARANFGLQEDFSGANVWNSPAPAFVDGNRQIGSETIATARQLSQELETAYISCDDSLDCQRLDRAIQDANNFLNSLNREQAEQLRRSRALRIW